MSGCLSVWPLCCCSPSSPLLLRRDLRKRLDSFPSCCCCCPLSLPRSSPLRQFIGLGALVFLLSKRLMEGKEGEGREGEGPSLLFHFPIPKRVTSPRAQGSKKGGAETREENRGGQQQRQGFYLGQIRLLNSTDAFFFFLCSLLPQPPYLSTAGRRLKERTKGRERLEGREGGKGPASGVTRAKPITFARTF